MRTSVPLSLATLALALACSAQNLSYTLLPSAAPQPSPRFDGTITYDPSSRQVFLFGGQDTSPRNDLWSYSLADRRWVELQPSGAVPPARFGHTLVFDSVRNRLVLFGGQAGAFFSDLWAFDLASGSWRKLSDNDAGPSRRYGHSAIYETARDRMVISHGFTDAGRFDDTWSYDFSANTWRDISPSGARPLRRCLHHAAYDAARGQMYLYGGCSSGFGPCPQGDLWSFDLSLNRWTERTPSNSPPPREHYGMAFDAARAKLVVFGGNGNGLLNDTWEFDPLTALWKQTALDGPPPSSRQRQESVYAPDISAILFFGGVAQSGFTNELWMLGAAVAGGRPSVRDGGVVNAFSGQGGAVAPGEAISLYGAGLGPADGVAASFDSKSGQLPTSLAGVQVSWNGVLSPLFFTQSGQVNAQVPFEVASAPEAKLVVTVAGQAADPITVPVQSTRVGLVSQVWNQDGSINAPGNAALPGSILVLYATGQGVTNPASLTGVPANGTFPEPVAATSVLVGGVAAEILFRGQAPGTVGVMQVNARIPGGVAPGVAVPIVLSVGASQAQTTAAIGAP